MWVLTRLIGVSGRWRRLQASPRGKQRVQTFWEKDNININTSPSNIPGLGYSPPTRHRPRSCSAMLRDVDFRLFHVQNATRFPGSSSDFWLLAPPRGFWNRRTWLFNRLHQWAAVTSWDTARLGEKIERCRKLLKHASLAQNHWPTASAADTPGHIDLFIVF